MRLARLLVAIICLSAPACAAAATGKLTVFAAASLTEALQRIGEGFTEKSGTPVRLVLAASSTLARQIEAGAPADVVALASPDWADYLAERGLIVPDSRTDPVGGELVLVAPTGAGIHLADPITADAIIEALGPHGRLAIGDPAHVPAGIYAREALESLGLWQALEPRLAYADNVRAALALVAHGDAPLGVVYATDVRSAPEVERVGSLPEASHAPIAFAFAAVSGGDVEVARAFLAYLDGPEGLAVFEQLGFTRR